MLNDQLRIRNAVNGLCIIGALLSVLATGGCKPPEPDPSLATDLGREEGENLLLTPPAWHDKGIAKGQAEWKPFRKPSDIQTAEAPKGGPAGTTETGGAGGAVEKEIRELVDEYNGLIKEGKYKEAFDYLTDEQVVIAEQAVEQIQKYAQALRELAEVAPGCREHINRALPALSVPYFLVFGAADLKINGESEVTGILGDVQTHRPIPNVEPYKVRFIRDEDGYWLIEGGHIAGLSEIISAMRSSLEVLTSFVDEIKSGAVAESEIESRCEELKQPLDKLTRLLGNSIPVAPESAGAATKEKSDSEPPPAEAPPEPKKPAPGG